jgi:hypothetical protein
MLLRLLIFLHRWVGIAICLVFLLWFPSGIGMMYWTYPDVSAGDKLDRSPALDSSKVVLSPVEAAEKLGVEASPAQIRLNTFDGRPVYRVAGGGRGGGGRGGGGRIIYADTGEEQTDVSHEMRDRIAGAWTGKPASAARIESIDEVDQWTIQYRNRPLYKYSWPNGEQLYVAGNSGDVIQYTTLGSRIAAHVSAIPHWVYYTPLRKRQPVWINFMIYTALIGTISSIVGIVIGVWMYSPSKRYRLAGRPTGIPYRGQKRWHTIFGLVFGIATATWAFSGLLSLGPFPILERLQGGDGGQRRGGGQNVAGALRGRVQMADFASTHPRDLLAKASHLQIKELEFTSFDGKPVFAANLGSAGTQMISPDGTPIAEFDRQQIIDIVKKAAPDANVVETRIVEQYDLYYLDRTRQRPLPVILALMNDEAKTRYYIDPKTARVVQTYSNRNWINRWLYNGLHSLNFPWLYNYRPLWDIVVITFMLGGTALCVTSLVLGWRVLGRKLRRATQSSPNDMLPVESPYI